MRIVVALGGNALQAEGKPATAQSQLEVVTETVRHLVDIIEAGHELIIVHGNGPQVGRIVIQNELADVTTPAMPFDVCDAMSQGMIGYHIQQAIETEFHQRGMKQDVAAIVTQVVVDEFDQAFQDPTKPIGPFYTQEEANKLSVEKGYVMKEDAGRGYRRVVASPKPVEIVEKHVIELLVEQGVIPIACGGGGVPVVMENGHYKGVAAVIDKDFAAQTLATALHADMLVILTAVERVAIHYGTPQQQAVDAMSVEQAKMYIEAGHFPAGSMLPKVEAAIQFVQENPGKTALIAALEQADLALKGESGTIVHE
ncbi:MAG: carbamate kinase [Culicoidibacterales bacterium]